MSVQLGLELETATERRYACCGAPCPPLGKPYTLGGTIEDQPKPWLYPHTDDCENPMIGVWFTRDNRIIRKLHCIGADGRCPSGGRFRAQERIYDPYGGICCLVLRERATEATARYGAWWHRLYGAMA